MRQRLQRVSAGYWAWRGRGPLERPVDWVVAITVVFAGVLMCAAPAGAAVFSPADQISGACPHVSDLQVVMDGPGDEFAAWECEEIVGGANVYGVQEAMLPAGGSWSAVSSLGSADGPTAVSIAIDGGGHGLLVWSPSNGSGESEIDAAVIAPDGSITNQMTVSQAGGASREPHLALNAAGDAVVSWEHISSTGQGAAPFAALGTLSGGFQAPEQLDSYGERISPYPIAVAVDPSGDAAAAWVRDPLSGPQGPLSATVSIAGGPFSSPAAVPSDGAEIISPMITIDANGNVTVVWQDRTWSTKESRIDAARESLMGGFGPWQQISATLSEVFSAALASDPAGDTVVAWEGQVGGVGDALVEKAVFQAGMAFQPPVQVADAGTVGTRVSASMDGNGTPSVSWSEPTAGETFISYVSTGDPVVSQLPMGAVSPMLAGDAAGDLGAVWAGSTSSGTAIFGSNRSASPTVTAINPTGGPAAGGTAVTITGTNFTGVSAVKFGATQASFKVDSSTSISATSPPGTGTVGVTVTTADGASATSSADQFTYAAVEASPSEEAPRVTAGNIGPGGSSLVSTLVKATKPKALTRAQKLDRALNLCAKKPRRKRAACRKQARKKYGPGKQRTRTRA